MLLVKNNAYSALAAGITNVATSLTVTSGHGDRFPIAAGADYFKVTLQDAANNIEIIKVTARASGSDSMTIQRGQEGTTARAWNLGDVVEARVTAGILAPMQVFSEAATAADIRTAIDVPTRAGLNATGTWGISITGNAATATALQTARTINGVSFNGTANISINLNNSLTPGAFLTGSAFNGSAAQTFAVDATSANTASKVVARDASGNFSAGTITAALAGNATTATTLQTARTINGVSFNGSANISVNLNNSLTFNNGGAGGASGSTFNGSGALTVSYNTVGAPSTTGANASGTWGISITGSAATLDGIDSASFLRSDVADTKTSGNLVFNDSIQLAFGTSSDAVLYHNGTHTYFDQQVTGDLYIRNLRTSGSIFLQADNSGGTLQTCISLGGAANSVELFYGGAQKLATTAAGVTITGTATATTFSGALSGNATTATTLQTARTINGVSFNGSANITVTANTPNSLTAGNGLTGTTFNGGAASTFAIGTPSSVTNTSTNSVTATSHTHALDGELVESTGGSGAYYGARAFVNFQANTGTPSIRYSQNVSSITDVGVGMYRINMTTAQTDANYSVVGSAGTSNDQTQLALLTVFARTDNADREAPTTSAFLISTFNFNVGAFDPFDVCVGVFR